MADQSVAELFHDPESRIARVFVVVDIIGSSEFKTEGSEAEWLTTYEWFYALVGKAVQGNEGEFVKTVGDGALLAYDTQDAAAAINHAIAMLEDLKTERERGHVLFEVSIGIAYGEARRWVPKGGLIDYLGPTVDKAFRICGVAGANSLLVDADTCSAANLQNVKSTVGDAMGRTSDDYLGDRREVDLKGFRKPCRYYEILWDESRYGLVPGQEVGQSSFVIGSWDAGRVEESIANAPEDAEIWILQTWFPDHEQFMRFLESQLERKRLRLKILLVNPKLPGEGVADILSARIALRDVSRPFAASHVEQAVAGLVSIKKRIDALWARDGGRELDLEIRFYNFMPFGPIYGIGDREAFVGLYLLDRSSHTGPAWVLTDEASPEWAVVRGNFDLGWEQSIQAFPSDQTSD